LQAHVAEYQRLGAEVLVIVAQRPDKVAAYRRARRLTIPILIDADRGVIQRYGVYQRFGLTGVHLARPASFLIDRQQRIRFMHVGRGQRDRPDHAALLAALQQLPLPR
jgi:peroxiredoxin